MTPADKSDNEARSTSAAGELRRSSQIPIALTKRVFTTAGARVVEPFPRPDVLPDLQLVNDRLILVENICNAPAASRPLPTLLR